MVMEMVRGLDKTKIKPHEIWQFLLLNNDLSSYSASPFLLLFLLSDRMMQKSNADLQVQPFCTIL